MVNPGSPFLWCFFHLLSSILNFILSYPAVALHEVQPCGRLTAASVSNIPQALCKACNIWCCHLPEAMLQVDCFMHFCICPQADRNLNINQPVHSILVSPQVAAHWWCQAAWMMQHSVPQVHWFTRKNRSTKTRINQFEVAEFKIAWDGSGRCSVPQPSDANECHQIFCKKCIQLLQHLTTNAYDCCSVPIPLGQRSTAAVVHSIIKQKTTINIYITWHKNRTRLAEESINKQWSWCHWSRNAM